MAQQARLDVLDRQFLPQQRVPGEIDLPHVEVIGPLHDAFIRAKPSELSRATMLDSAPLIAAPNFCGLLIGPLSPAGSSRPTRSDAGDIQPDWTVQPTYVTAGLAQSTGPRSRKRQLYRVVRHPPLVLWLADRLTGTCHTLSNFRV
jgi:hypothetical protein